MDKKLWRKSYSSFPRFTCPRCGQGTLSKKHESFVTVEPKHITRELHQSGEIGDASYGRFHGFLVCSLMVCGEIVAVSGDYTEHYHTQWDQNTDEEVNFTDTSYYPFVMRPTPVMIAVPKSLNASSKLHLTKAYELFWSDWASCANRLRIVTEYLLDQMDIPRHRQKGGGGIAWLDLATRIDLLKEAQPGHEVILNALRVFGNLGSHDGVVDFDTLLDCFEFLEEAMTELLDGRRRKMIARAQEIVDRRGKPKA